MYIPSIVLHFTVISIITVHPFVEHIINLRVHITVHEIIHMKPHCVLLANFYSVGDIWIIRIELKSNIFQVSTKFVIE